jgi:hypothetical protein
MIPFALLLLAASTRVDLVDEVFEVPPAEWRYLELGLKQRAAYVSADYHVMGDSDKVRLELMTRDDLQYLRAHRPFTPMVATGEGRSGRLRVPIRRPGDYVIVLNNQSGTRTASVRLHVGLNFSGRPEPEVTTLSRGRQLAIVLISFAVFFAIAAFSARRLLRGIKR